MLRVLGFGLVFCLGFRGPFLGSWFKGFGIWLRVLGFVLLDLALGLGFRDFS